MGGTGGVGAVVVVVVVFVFLVRLDARPPARPLLPVHTRAQQLARPHLARSIARLASPPARPLGAPPPPPPLPKPCA